MGKIRKSNHHYVPQHWLRRFRDDHGNLWAREGDHIGVRGVDSVMSLDYLYTVFDSDFLGSDDLENQLGRIEQIQFNSLQQICRFGEPVGPGTLHDLAAILALQTLRHPDVLAWGRRRAVRFAELILKIKKMSFDEFMKDVAPALDDGSPDFLYEQVQAISEEQLEKELAEIQSWSPQNTELAETDTLSALISLSAKFHSFNMRVIEISEGDGAFVLGDTPIPQDDLGNGFTVPLSKRVAVAASLAPEGQRARIERARATKDEINFVNQAQWNRHACLVVGESREVLFALPPTNWHSAT